MRLRLPDIESVALFGLVALFPAFFLYHSAVGLFGLPPVLGGWFGPMMAILAPVLALLQFRRYQTGRDSLSHLDVLFLVLCGLIVMWSTLHLFAGAGYQRSWALWGQAVYTVVAWVACFVIFRHLDLNSKPLRWILGLSLFGMLTIALVYQESGFFYAAGFSDSSQGIASYQGFARSAFVVSIVLVCTVRKRVLPFVWISGLILLYVLGARSEFVSFVVVGTIVFIIKHGSLRTGVVVAFMAVAALMIDWGLLWQEYGNVRIARLLELDSDTSYLSRGRLRENAWLSIQSQPFMGDFGSHARTGSIGSYSHDALSAWAAYGIVGFLLFVSLLIASLFASVREVISSSAKDPVVLLALALTLQAVLMALAAKSVYWVLFGAGWGAAARLVQQRRQSRTKSVLQKSPFVSSRALPV